MSMKNYTGEKYGRLTVLNFSRKYKGIYYWFCRCDCGKIKELSIQDLKSGNTKSCGCLRKENPSRIKINNLSGTRIHKIYHNMKTRCFNQKSERYKDYGERGIKICDEWLGKFVGFNNFCDWAFKNGYNENLTLDRIDNDGNYCPENCRWVDMKTQRRNSRNIINITIGNETKCLKDWCCIYGIKESRILNYSKRNKISAKDSFIHTLKRIKDETGVELDSEPFSPEGKKGRES